MQKNEDFEVSRDKRHRYKGDSPVSSILSWISSLALLALILAAFIVAYMVGFGDIGPRILFGYSADIVLSGSMQSELPQGSLVLVKTVDPETIQIGDNITFIRADRNLITHKVVSITEDYDQSGMRGFTTQGIENPYPDRETVYADNVVGKVIFHSLQLGNILSYIKDRVWVVILGAVLVIAFFSALRYVFRVFRTPAVVSTDSKTVSEVNPDIPTGKTEPAKTFSEEAHT